MAEVCQVLFFKYIMPLSLLFFQCQCCNKLNDLTWEKEKKVINLQGTFTDVSLLQPKPQHNSQSHTDDTLHWSWPCFPHNVGEGGGPKARGSREDTFAFWRP